MKTNPKYFRNKFDMDDIKTGTLWILNGKYVQPVDEKYNLMVYYESHEHWFSEVENPVEENNQLTNTP